MENRGQSSSSSSLDARKAGAADAAGAASIPVLHTSGQQVCKKTCGSMLYAHVAAGIDFSNAGDRRVGELVAQRAQQVGLTGVHWPRRRGERFHGKRAALINAMRAAGLPLI